jgi:hypothetical protein
VGRIVKRGLPDITMLCNCLWDPPIFTLSCFLGAWSWTHTPSSKKIKNAWNCNCVTLYASMLISLRQVLKRQAVSWCKILKISSCFVFFVHSWEQGKGTHHHALDQMWCVRGAADVLEKVSFKNKLSFHWFYIFLNFTLILIGPLRKVKCAFHYVSLLAIGL